MPGAIYREEGYEYSGMFVMPLVYILHTYNLVPGTYCLRVMFCKRVLVNIRITFCCNLFPRVNQAASCAWSLRCALDLYYWLLILLYVKAELADY